jgi:hypothetical protein
MTTAYDHYGRNPYASWTIEEMRSQMKHRTDWIYSYVKQFADKIKQASTVADEIHSRAIEANMISAASQWFRYATSESKTQDSVDPAFLDFDRFLGWIRDDVKAKCIFYRREQPAWVDSDSTLRCYTRDPRHYRYIAENIDKVIRPAPTPHKTGQDVYLDDFS